MALQQIVFRFRFKCSG